MKTRANAAVANDQATQTADDLAVLAAMDLLGEGRWLIDNVAKALGRDPAWLTAKIDGVLAEDIPDNQPRPN